MSTNTFSDILAEVDSYLKTWRSTKDTISVLEAGGGSKSYVQLSGADIVTAIDISQEQLNKNTYATHKILRDLHTFRLDDHAYDLIVCFDVLEHLDRPDDVLQSFVQAVKSEGIIYLAAPYNRSFFGLLTKYTPHWFHVFVYRYFFRSATAGRPGYAPFPTTLRKEMNPYHIVCFAENHNLDVKYFRLYERGHRDCIRRKSRMLGGILDGMIWIGNCVMPRKNFEMSDYIMLLQKK
jgi:SAM-dependent methyltransferase